jgi:uncharacterized damage-inducible protein DinB
MTPTVIAGKPAETEYASYYGRYVALVADPDIVAALDHQLKSTRTLLDTISEEKAGHRYEPGKWSIKQLVGHIADTERIFAHRALRFARNDRTELPGFDENAYAANANFGDLPLSSVVEEYATVRQASIVLFKHLEKDAWNRRGIANKNEVSVRAIAFLIAGHELHHIGILKTRYL